MPKTKKKHHQSDHQKVLNAQHRNEFLNKLRFASLAVTGEDVFKLIPPQDYNLLMFLRARPILAVPEEGESISPKIIEAIQGLINYFIKKVKMPVEISQKPISVADFYTAGLTFSRYSKYLNDHIAKGSTKNTNQIVSIITNSYLEFEQQFNIIFDKLNDELFPFLIRSTNAFWDCYFSFCIEVSTSKDKAGIQYQIVVKTHKSEKKHFLIEDNVRPAFRIGWTFQTNEFEWLDLSPAELGITSFPQDRRIPIYIQSHALNRIFERIDCIHINEVMASIYLSLRRCVYTKNKNKFIIEFAILDVKVGYLSAVMIEGNLVIRTFLFLTFNGMPEGKRLEEFIGLKSLDTKYLKMDRLSSFMTGKLRENEKLRSIFEKADCLNLIELYDKLDQFSRFHPDHSPVEMLASYLETERN